LTGLGLAGMLKSMPRLYFAAIVVLLTPLWPRRSEAQRVPARDLLSYPLGTLAEAPALATETGDGFQNPASIRLARGTRVRGTVVALNTGTDRGVSAQLASVAVALPQQITVAFSAARATIDDIGHTVDDPEPIGRDIPYSTLVLSLSGARQSIEHVTSGIAVRYRTGEVAGFRQSTFGLDGGLLVDRIFGYDARLGVSSFMWGPGADDSKDASFSAAADARAFGPDSTRQARLGYSFTFDDRASAGHYVFASGRYSRWIGRVGIAHHDIYGTPDTSLRLALGVRYARYAVGLSREESAEGFEPTYQFVLSGTFR
jgi:hypothetical protein